MAELRAEVEEKERLANAAAYQRQMKLLETVYGHFEGWFHHELQRGLEKLATDTKTDPTKAVSFTIPTSINTTAPPEHMALGQTYHLNTNEVVAYAEHLMQQKGGYAIEKGRHYDLVFNYAQLAQECKAAGYGLWTAGEGGKYILTLWPTVPRYANFDYKEECLLHSLRALGYEQVVIDRMMRERAADFRKRKVADATYTAREAKRMRNECVVQ